MNNINKNNKNYKKIKLQIHNIYYNYKKNYQIYVFYYNIHLQNKKYNIYNKIYQMKKILYIYMIDIYQKH